MKIEFESEEQKEKFFDVLVDNSFCPSEIGIMHADNCSSGCRDCLENAILCSVADGE